MIRPWTYLNAQDQEAFRTAVIFLEHRLSEQETIDWALKLKPGQRIERIAIEALLNGLGPRDIAEPWVTAWRLIEEAWSNINSDDDGTAVYQIQARMRRGDHSGSTIAAIVNLVKPRLKVEPIELWRWNYVRKPRTPKRFEHVLSASLTSGQLVDLGTLELANLDDITFLSSLANSLEAAVKRGLDIARRLGWNDKRSLLGLGALNRVYYTRPTRRADGDGEPDAYHKGIAPSVKLLHAVVSQIANVHPELAQSFVNRWAVTETSVFVRLWAAMARNDKHASAVSVASFLKSIDNQRFWNIHIFPEIAELRAVRFGELDRASQTELAARLQKGPPRSQWPRAADKAKVARARQYWAVRELRRIEVEGGRLPARSEKWLAARLPLFPDLIQMTADAGFPQGVTVGSVPSNPDRQYDELVGQARLQALETALATQRGGWDDDPAERANDWINQGDNASKVLADFEDSDRGGDTFPRVWSRFGWAHSPLRVGAEEPHSVNLSGDAQRVLSQLDQLSDATLLAAIEGITAWLDAWEKQVVGLSLMLRIWLRLWPIAVQATNQRSDEEEEEEEVELNATVRELSDDDEPADLDTLNTPAGKLVGVFLAACPPLSKADIFREGSAEWRMRDAISAASGRSELIAKHRMIEQLPYFLRADQRWAEYHLIAPLLNDDGSALALWRAVARRTHLTDVLKIIGVQMAERANDRRIDRETRRRLVFSLVVESLFAFREDREPAVPNARIQQMLRTLDDEVRASAANAIQVFVRDVSANPPRDQRTHTASGLFDVAARPFIELVWPQERSLTTPGVSRAFADLPATCGEAFAQAVDVIARFLVPFDCWSMVEYGFHRDEQKTGGLSAIDSEEKAKALLKLLDLTIGVGEGAVIPYDISDALEQISRVAPALTETSVFRRLAAAARR